MAILNNFLKAFIRALSGYKIRHFGMGSASSIVLAQDNIEISSCDPDGLLLVNTEKDESIATRGVHRCLQALRLKNILDTYKVNLVIDVGANEGQFAEILRKAGYEGRILSFEPLSIAYQVLRDRATKDPGWGTYKLALGKKGGEQVINVAERSMFSSFLKSNSWCEQRFGQKSIGSTHETVMVSRLDEVLSEAIKDIEKTKIYLKMDTQGYDLEVFEGVGKFLKYIVALQSEVSAIPIYENMPHITDSISVFEKSGFVMAGMYPIGCEKSTLQVVEFDCMMVKASSKK